MVVSCEEGGKKSDGGEKGDDGRDSCQLLWTVIGRLREYRQSGAHRLMSIHLQLKPIPQSDSEVVKSHKPPATSHRAFIQPQGSAGSEERGLSGRPRGEEGEADLFRVTPPITSPVNKPADPPHPEPAA